MRRFRLLLLLAAVPVLASAVGVSYVDPFGWSATNCQKVTCDVVGDRLWFDLDKFSMLVDPVLMTGMINIQTNFGPGTDLSPFMDRGVRLNAADILFSDTSGVQFGIALTAHGGSLQAGHLYKVQDSAGVMTASDVLRLRNGYVYRTDFDVWLKDDGHGSVSDEGSGSVSTTMTGNGINSGRFTITVNFTPSADFIAGLETGAFDAQFASATCGNDIMWAHVAADPQTPEASTAAMLAAGLVCAGLYKLQAAAPTIRRVFRS